MSLPDLRPAVLLASETTAQRDFLTPKGCRAPSFFQTDWAQIVELYRMLERTRPSGVVRVNRAIAEAELGGPEIGLRLLDETPGLEGWHFYWAARAELLRRAGRQEEAAGCYRRALSCEMNDSDRSFLERRLAEMSAE